MHNWDIEYEDVYSEESDMTFIMENHYDNGTLKTITCVGWYFGEPSVENDEYYKHKLTSYH